MAQIKISDISFTYTGQLTPLFEHVSLSLDTAWRLGLVGRNGRGKTTFLKLLLGQLEYTGSIYSPERFEYFPVAVQDDGQSALTVARQTIAPFDEWEQRMETLAAEGTAQAMEEYGELEEQYAAADGYVINESLLAETGRLGIAPEALQRPFCTLSGGEQVKLLLAALFLKKHRFLLIDEPTDHLDAEGRRTVAKWLAGKSGFILVSHDRAFLDEAVDHILSINRADIELQKGNYSSWRHNRDLQDSYEAAENKRLEGEIRHLKAAAKRTENWSDKIEKGKKGAAAAANSDGGQVRVDRGFIGHKAAKMMQRSKSIERRHMQQAEEKQALLKNVEAAEPLKFHVLKPEKNPMLSVQDVSMGYGERQLLRDLSFTLSAGQRIALRGANGSGKTTLLRLVCGQLTPDAGKINTLAGLQISTLKQDTGFLRGGLKAFAATEGVDVSLFLAILRKLDFEREAFEQPVERYSAGQKKKVCLAASLARPAHLFVWDEPLNYIDVLSREQVEAAILECRPSMLLVEHDAAFVQKVATDFIDL